MLPSELLSLERERPKISWELISKAITYYQNRGFSYIEVPWLVSKEATGITYAHENIYANRVGEPVGSAEQSFLDLEINGLLSKDLYKIVTCSPCWREEEAYDKWHQTSFMKVELFVRGNKWKELLDEAEVLFKRIGFNSLDIVKCSSDNAVVQYDINYKGIELGSYGYRINGDYVWSYGTGLAEPRTSLALAL